MSEFLRREIPAAETHIAVECVWQPLVSPVCLTLPNNIRQRGKRSAGLLARFCSPTQGKN